MTLPKKNRIITALIGQKAKGRFRVLVTEAGRMVRDYGWQKNLILNQGLDGVCSTRTWADAMTFCAAGSGTTPTESASGANPATGTTGTFTNDTPGTFDFTTLSAVGDMIQMTSGADSGAEVRITTVTDQDNVVYTPAINLASGEFIVFRTSQTGLTTELKRTNSYLTGSGNCGSSIVSTTVTLRRTFDFTAEVGAVTYNEVGVSHTGTVASNLFSRILLSSPVNLVAGQALRIIYDLDITIGNTTPVAHTFNVAGWPVAPSTTTDGDYQIIRPGINGILTNGVTASSSGNSMGGVIGSLTDGGRSLEPSLAAGNNDALLWISPSSAAIDSFASTGQPTDRKTNSTTFTYSLNSYTNFDFARDRSGTLAIGEANRTDFRSMGMGGNKTTSSPGQADDEGQSFVCLFDEAQTKDSLHTLTLNFRISVGRVLA